MLLPLDPSPPPLLLELCTDDSLTYHSTSHLPLTCRYATRMIFFTTLALSLVHWAACLFYYMASWGRAQLSLHHPSSSATSSL